MEDGIHADEGLVPLGGMIYRTLRQVDRVKGLLVHADDFFLSHHGSELVEHDLAAEALLLDQPTVALTLFLIEAKVAAFNQL